MFKNYNLAGNTLNGKLVAAPPASDQPDSFVYDPMNPVPSFGGNACCTGKAITGGSFNQRKNGRTPGRSRLQHRTFEERH